MMTKSITAARVARALLASLVLATGAAQAAPAIALQDGVNYKRLEPAVPLNVAPGKAEVVEVFWYACGHCYLLEPKLETWERTGKPSNVVLMRLPATWNDILKTHARLFYTAELLGKLPAWHADLFREINVKGNRLDTPAAMQAYFVAHGVSAADFQKAYSSFAVESKVRRAEDLNRRYKITGTPTVIVNGKYVTDVAMAGSEEKLFQVIGALLALR
jgi:protein dithiol oxidoreductase (disulfide-forming)